MGRLIDADEMIDKYGEWYTEEGTEEGFIGTLEGVVYMMPTVEAIPLDWIRNYISNLKAMGVQLSLRDAQAISVMVDKYMMEQNGNATCGPDYCEIGGHDEQA